jgi:hypothetical protein
MRVSNLFDPEPETWGLTNDPHLWRALRAHLADQDVSASVDELASSYTRHSASSPALTSPAPPPRRSIREQYAHGGMSGGMISLGVWRQRLIPMLSERARARLPGRPYKADRGLQPAGTLPGTLRYASPCRPRLRFGRR